MSSEEVETKCAVVEEVDVISDWPDSVNAPPVAASPAVGSVISA